MTEIGHNTDVPEFIVTTEGEILGQDSPENREIVRRINACVNACQDLTTEELEQGILQDMRQVLSDVVPLLERQQGTEPDLTASPQPHFREPNSEIANQKEKFFG